MKFPKLNSPMATQFRLTLIAMRMLHSKSSGDQESIIGYAFDSIVEQLLFRQHINSAEAYELRLWFICK